MHSLNIRLVADGGPQGDLCQKLAPTVPLWLDCLKSGKTKDFAFFKEASVQNHPFWHGLCFKEAKEVKYGK
ncbi:MAG: hypothetical protein CMH56_12750 [Myxococcales bacterium]|nr:hypothetical protein [Myxococcales bacterium]|tara:strand:+ start:225 stop:437 length:213 start_codon:yes stop_codon:yes gene_type:complete